MKEVIVKYTCDICGYRAADRHFKIKEPVSGTKLKKWERIDICGDCYHNFYNMCRSKKGV